MEKDLFIENTHHTTNMPTSDEEKPHISIVICGHIDSGKSTTTGRLLYELGGISERELEKMRKEAQDIGKNSFEFAFFLDKQKEERKKGVTISCTTKEFFTDKYHYTIIDAPGHRDFIKNMIVGSAQADVCLLMVPADGNFVSAIQKGDRKAGEIAGQTREHANLINLLGVKQLIVGINKMDTMTAGPWAQSRYDEVANEMKDMLMKTGWKKDFIENVPMIPLSGYLGENMLKPSDKMTWWKGQKVKNLLQEDVTITTLLDALNLFVAVPPRKEDAPMRLPISNIYNIKGVGQILAGRVEQGTVIPGKDVVFVPTHTAANPCPGRIFSLEMHHRQMDKAGPGDNIGMSIKNLNKDNLPRAGDVMVYKDDKLAQGQVKRFTAQVQTREIPGEIKIGYSPIGHVRCGKSACRITELKWKIGKETGKKRMENPHSLKSNEVAEVVLEPTQPLMVDTFDSCEGLSRIAFMDGNSCVMLGKIVSVERV